MISYKHLAASLLLAGCISSANAQPQRLTDYRPSHEEIIQRYRDAAELDSLARNSIFKTTVLPNWQADNKGFWYRNNLKDSVQEYIYVDALAGKKAPAFDHAQLAAALSQASGKTVNAK